MKNYLLLFSTIILVVGFGAGCSTQRINTSPAAFSPSRPIPLQISSVRSVNESRYLQDFAAFQMLPRDFKANVESPNELIKKSFVKSEYALHASLEIQEEELNGPSFDQDPLSMLGCAFTLTILPTTLDITEHGYKYSIKLTARQSGVVILTESGEGSATFYDQQRMEFFGMWVDIFTNFGEKKRERLEPIVPRTAFNAAFSDLLRHLDARRGEIVDLTRKYKMTAAETN